MGFGEGNGNGGYLGFSNSDGELFLNILFMCFFLNKVIFIKYKSNFNAMQDLVEASDTVTKTAMVKRSA